jgi:hypothetical protein
LATKYGCGISQVFFSDLQAVSGNRIKAKKICVIHLAKYGAAIVAALSKI